VISPTTIAQIRDRTDIVALIGESVRLVRRGRSFLGLCPFHKEKTPSFSVSAERGYFYCFGCKENGSAIDFVMKLEGKSFPEAARSLAERAGIEVEETATDAERREANAARRTKDDLYNVNALAATFFEHCLRDTGESRLREIDSLPPRQNRTPHVCEEGNHRRVFNERPPSNKNDSIGQQALVASASRPIQRRVPISI